MAGSAGQLVRRVLSSPGRPLSPAELSAAGAAPGADFSAVRVHDDPDAATSARAVGAGMYTSGSHIVAGEGYAGPGTASGRRSLTHELYHVKQQARGPVAGTPAGDGLSVSDASDHDERAAQRAGEQLAGWPGSPPGPGIALPKAGATAPWPSRLPVQRETMTKDGVTYKSVPSGDGNAERTSQVAGWISPASTKGRGPTPKPKAWQAVDLTQWKGKKLADIGEAQRQNYLGYHGGHVLALSLGGINESINVVPMYPRFNTGPWKNLEDRIKEKYSQPGAGDDLDHYLVVRITPEYVDNPAIPASLEVVVWTTAAPPPAVGPAEDLTDAIENKIQKKEALRETERQPQDIGLVPGLSEDIVPAVVRGRDDQMPEKVREKAGKAVAEMYPENMRAAVKKEVEEKGVLPRAEKRGWPDDPANRPYGYLDILFLAGELEVIPGSRGTLAPGWNFAAWQRQLILQVNKARHGGHLQSDDAKDIPELNEQGTYNAPEIDHIIPMSLGGSNAFSNARVVSWYLNNVEARVKPIHQLIGKDRFKAPPGPRSWGGKAMKGWIKTFLEWSYGSTDKLPEEVTEEVIEDIKMSITSTYPNDLIPGDSDWKRMSKIVDALKPGIQAWVDELKGHPGRGLPGEEGEEGEGGERAGKQGTAAAVKRGREDEDEEKKEEEEQSHFMEGSSEEDIEGSSSASGKRAKTVVEFLDYLQRNYYSRLQQGTTFTATDVMNEMAAINLISDDPGSQGWADVRNQVRDRLAELVEAGDLEEIGPGMVLGGEVSYRPSN